MTTLSDSDGKPPDGKPPHHPLSSGFSMRSIVALQDNVMLPATGTGTLGSKPKAQSALFGLIESDLQAVERVLATTLEGYQSPFGPLLEHLKQYQGKRLRPALVLLTAQTCGGVREEHHTLAAVVEMIHTATLVHDDVLDEAEVRRHSPTINREWGNKVSILFGDMLFTHAFHLSSTVDRRACELIGEATNRVCAGELRQVSEKGNLHLSHSDYFAIIDGKTAALTEVSCRLGGLYAGADQDTSDRLACYGKNLGLAFQVADDLLDLVGDPNTVGKTLGTDLEQQKLTLPLIHARDHLPAARSHELLRLLDTGDSRHGPAIAKLLEEAGSLQYARARAESFAVTAQQAISPLPESEAKSLLMKMAYWSIRREK